MSDQPTAAAPAVEQKPEKIYYDTPYGRRPPPKPVVEEAPKAPAAPEKERVYYDTPYGRKPPAPADTAATGDSCCEDVKRVNHNYCSNLI